MNSITELLDLEDSDITISDTCIEETRKISHPILQDGYELVLKQRRWRCTNPVCSFESNEEFRFVNKRRRSTNATDMLIILVFRDQSASAPLSRWRKENR